MTKKMSIFVILLCTGFLLFPGVGLANSSKNLPIATNGILDLSTWDFKKDGIATLSGEWEFYWNELLTPADFKNPDLQNRKALVKAPALWTNYNINGKKLPVFGYATYRIKILLPKSHPALAFKTGNAGTTLSVFFGNTVNKTGTPGKSINTSVPLYCPRLIPLENGEPQMNVVLQTSNFHIFDSGLVSTIEIGTQEELTKNREKNIAIELFLFSSFFIISLYHLIFYFFKKGNKSPLWFGLFCACLL